MLPEQTTGVSTAGRVQQRLLLTSVNSLLAGLGGDDTEAGDLLGDLDGLLDDGLSLLSDAGSETPVGSLGTRHHAVGEDHVHGTVLANEVDKTLRATTTGNNTEGDLGLGKDGLGGADDEVGHHGKLTATTELILALSTSIPTA